MRAFWRARSWASNVRRAFCARRAGKKREKALPWAAVGAGDCKPTQRAEKKAHIRKCVT